ncbi:hypothetical protein GQX73_g5026 [Xylaria multiplex]|uniref:VLRF1 domain-containing protein n=1 Tax=Xylaria multiplex TaxID=323545 RepID=A0A7C8MRD2_9PEZI|nr:hypothetical protein GQX73_g5026 [Xylaria multiplex]
MAPTTDKKTEDLLKRPLYVYDLPHEVLSTLTFSLNSDAESHHLGTGTPLPSSLESQDTSRNTSTENLVGSQACSLCALSFATVEDQRSHQKSDWHHYNLKQKLRGAKPVSEAEFENLVSNLDESLSGSESSESDDDGDDDDRSSKESTLTALLKKQARLADRNAQINSGNIAIDEGDDGLAQTRQRGSGRPPLLWFSSPLLPTNNYFGIYRTIFSPEDLRDESDIINIIKKKAAGPNINTRAQSGRKLAATGIQGTTHLSVHDRWREATVLAHKTFHRYTTRRKQGGSQSANDNAKGNAHSAGSSIRRYNEQALTDEVRLLLQDWKGLLDTSELLFIRATGATNRRTLFGPYDGQVLRANDPRIRGFPFSTRRATQNELMRSFIELTRLKVREIDPAQTAKPAQESLAKAAPAKPSKPVAPKLTEEEETAQLHTSQLQAFIRRSKLPALLSYLKSNDLQPDFRFEPADSQQNYHAPTPLHLAASQNSAALVSGLLLKAGADPTVQSNEGKVPFDLAGDRATRDAFRVARDELGESAWNWEAAHVPAALKRADAERREERERVEAERKEAERRAAEEIRLRREGPKAGDAKTGKGRSVLDAGVPRSAQDRREEEARGLTPEQRLKLDRERRARAAEERFRRMQQGTGG